MDGKREIGSFWRDVRPYCVSLHIGVSIWTRIGAASNPPVEWFFGPANFADCGRQQHAIRRCQGRGALPKPAVEKLSSCGHL